VRQSEGDKSEVKGSEVLVGDKSEAKGSEVLIRKLK
jgi:hypothetical protein